MVKWEAEVGRLEQPGCWLRSSHHLKACNQLTGRESARAEDVTGLNHAPKEAAAAAHVVLLVESGAFCKACEGVL